MPHTCRVFDSIDQVDLTAWQRVCSESGASIFMDPRFIAGIETSMKQDCRFWHVIVDDDAGRPVACAGLAAMTVDLTNFSDPGLARVIKRIPFLSRFRNLRVLFCSLPGSPGEKSLALTQTDASAQILPALDGVMHDLAKTTGMDAIMYKELGQQDLPWMSPLLERGYRQIPIPPMHVFKHSFADFAQYCGALNTNYRQQINRSVRKLKDTGIQPLVFADPKEIVKMYTPEVHAMYCDMVAKSDVKLETFPIEYFHQLARQLSSEADLITLCKDGRIIAFGWGLHDGSTYHLMYAGLDDRLKREYDLYFNLFYTGFDRAFRKGVERIHVGQTATGFKARMGCESAPLYVFAKGLGPVMSPFFYYGARWVVINKPSHPASHIFRSGFAAADSRPRERSIEDRDRAFL